MQIGIITHFYKNLNYGGVLQACALCKALERMGYSAEQISYQMKPKSLAEKDHMSLGKRILFEKKQGQLVDFLKNGGIRVSERVVTKCMKKKFQNIRRSKERKFQDFCQRYIPHSVQSYSEKDIGEAENNYDVLITGSDQVWNPDWYCSDFFLKFVQNGTSKLSYAAGISKSDLTPRQEQIFRNNLNDFTAISVREEEAVALIEKITEKSVAWVLDPTLLLDSEEWEKMCAPAICKEKYAVCYYLSENAQGYRVAKQYAKRHKLKLVNIAYTHNKFRWKDMGYGDYVTADISPEEFISAIKYAECVFTDSFHAVVFSAIFQRPFFVFNRVGAKGMGARINSLTRLLHLQERFCDTEDKATIDYVESVPEIDYVVGKSDIEKMRDNSLKFLRDNLNAIEKMEKQNYAN